MAPPAFRHGRAVRPMLEGPKSQGTECRSTSGWTSRSALEGVEDGATVFISGFGGAGFPNKLIRALRERGPKDLTLVVNSATHRYSLTHELIEADLVRKVICTAARGHFKDPSPFETRWMAGKIELEMVPQGTFTERIRAGGAGIPAFYTPVGFGTELTKDKEVRRFGAARLRARAGDHRRPRAGARRRRRPHRQSDLPLRADELRPGDGNGSKARGRRGARGLATIRCRTSACSCPASMSTAWCRHERAQSIADRVARRPGHFGRPGGQSRHRPAGALLRLSAARTRRDPAVGERRGRRRPARRARQGRHRPGRRRQPPHHAAPGRLDHQLLVVVRDDPRRPHRRDHFRAPSRWRRTAISPTGTCACRTAARWSAARWISRRRRARCG